MERAAKTGKRAQPSKETKGRPTSRQCEGRQKPSLPSPELKKQEEKKKSDVKKVSKPAKTSFRSQRRHKVDVLTEVAMENAYYIAHNAQDLLYFRGYRWQGVGKKKKRGKKAKQTSR